MLIRYYGHAMFGLTFESGKTLVTDPYGAFYQYPARKVKADVCTISHHHHDHEGVELLEGAPVLLDQPGYQRPCEGITAMGVETFHDECRGQKRGENLAFVIEGEGLRVVHLGDLGHMPDEAQAAQLSRADVLLIPVGGNYTIDAETALRVMERLAPRVTIPMHYRTRFNPDMPVDSIEPFLRLAGVQPEPMTLCRITAEDIARRPAILHMTPPEGE